MFAGFVRHGIPADCPDRLVTGNALHRHAPVSVGTGTRLGRRRFEGRVHALVGVQGLDYPGSRLICNDFFASCSLHRTAFDIRRRV